MTDEFLLILAAFGVVLWLTVIFTRRRTLDHDNSFTSRTETPHVVPVPSGHTIHTRPALRYPDRYPDRLSYRSFYTPGPSTTVVYDDDTVDMLAQAAALAVVNDLDTGQTVSYDDPNQLQQFTPGGGDSGGGGATGSWDAPDDSQQQADPEPEPDPEPEQQSSDE